MADECDREVVDSQEVLRLLEDVRSRIRTVIWALHGMHQDMTALSVDDLADLEQLLTETVDQVLAPAYEAATNVLGMLPDGVVTTH